MPSPDVQSRETPREKMKAAVQRLGERACLYAGKPWPDRTCDCKYGVESDTVATERVYAGEQSGCPELRDVFSLLKAMTDEEYDAIQERIADAIAAAWSEYKERNPDAH